MNAWKRLIMAHRIGELRHYLDFAFSLWVAAILCEMFRWG